jgi:DNA-binding CsgD family transcriptional regulator/mono/diheme cytochrome c family protein
VALTVADRLLERARELGTLAELVRTASQGAGAAAIVEGEAGIGKSALLAAAAEHAAASGMAVLTATAGELESDFAWGVVHQLFDGAVARVPAAERARLLDGAAALARPALGIEATQETAEASHATLHGLYWLTVNLAQARPLLLSIDDLHWADSPSLRFIAHLLPRIAGLPILLLIASRPPGAEPAAAAALLARITAAPGMTALNPAALSQQASITLVRGQMASDISDDVCVACHQLTGGNPFLLGALMAELADEELRGIGVTVEHVRRMTPAAVSASILLRLARLPANAAALARATATLGAGTGLHTAGRLAGLAVDEAAECAVALIRAGMLVDEGTLGFVHPLVRSAVLGDLAGPERSRWHHRAARLLADENAPFDRIATHAVQSIPNGDPWTVEQLRRGAADAGGRGAPDVAADYLRRALAEPPGEAIRVEVLYELGKVELLQDPIAATTNLRDALEFAREPDRRASIALALGDALTLVGRLADAIPVFRAGIAELGRDRSSELRASLEAALLGTARWEPSAQALRHELVGEIRKRADAGTPLDPRLHSQLAVETTAEGTDLDAAVRHARVALSAPELPASAATSGLHEPMLVLAFADLAEEARDGFDQWLANARVRAQPLATVLGATTASLACLYRGAVSEAVAHAWSAANPGVEIWLSPVSVAFLVEALIERGDLDAARQELAARGLDAELPLAWATTPVLFARGRLHAAAGDHAAAIADLTLTGTRAEAWGVRNPAMQPWRSSLATSLAQIGERDQAVALAEEEVELARGWGTPRAIGVALRAAGIAYGGDHGVALLREAVDVLKSSTAPLEHARALTDLGAVLRRLGRRAEAREHLRKGLDLAHQLGGIHVADRARNELTIAGARPRRDALRGRDALTPSELRVAQLAADGRTNREIAEHLFITLRTVEAHLTSTYGKLELSSRHQLASALASSTN